MKFSVHLSSLDDLRQIILPPSMVCVSPTTITATWFVSEQITPSEARTLAKIVGFPYGVGDGVRVSFHPKTSYTIEDVTARVHRDALRLAMSGPCRSTSSVKQRNRLYSVLPDFSEKALESILVLPTINYPNEWVNEEIDKAKFLEHVFRATRDTPDAFLWVERDGTWVNLRSVTKWWNQRYRQMISVNEAAEMIGGKTRVLTVNGVRLSYRPIKTLDILKAR